MTLPRPRSERRRTNRRMQRGNVTVLGDDRHVGCSGTCRLQLEYGGPEAQAESVGLQVA